MVNKILVIKIWLNLLRRGVHGALVSNSAIAPWIHGALMSNNAITPWIPGDASVACVLCRTSDFSTR